MRGYNDTLVLSLLVNQDSYGYEISQRITEMTGGTYSIKETTLYSTFTRLEKQGYISSYEGTVTQGRRRMYYTITQEGRVYYKEKCEEWGQIKDVIDIFTKETTHATDY